MGVACGHVANVASHHHSVRSDNWSRENRLGTLLPLSLRMCGVPAEGTQVSRGRRGIERSGEGPLSVCSDHGPQSRRSAIAGWVNRCCPLDDCVLSIPPFSHAGLAARCGHGTRANRSPTVPSPVETPLLGTGCPRFREISRDAPAMRCENPAVGSCRFCQTFPTGIRIVIAGGRESARLNVTYPSGAGSPSRVPA